VRIGQTELTTARTPWLSRVARAASHNGSIFVWANSDSSMTDTQPLFELQDENLVPRVTNLDVLPLGRGACLLSLPPAWSDALGTGLFLFGGDGPSNAEGDLETRDPPAATSWAIRLDAAGTIDPRVLQPNTALPAIRGKGTACAVDGDDIVMATTTYLAGDYATDDGDVGNDGVLVRLSFNTERRPTP
jgi:hypothetical protein